MGLLSYIPIVNRFLPQEEPQASAPVVESQSPFGDTVAAAPGSNGARGAVLNGASAAPPAGLAAAGAFGGELGQGAVDLAPAGGAFGSGRAAPAPRRVDGGDAGARPQEPSWARWEDGLRDARPARRSLGGERRRYDDDDVDMADRRAYAAPPRRRYYDDADRGYSEVGPPRYYEEDYGWDDRRGRPARRYDDDGYGYEPRPPVEDRFEGRRRPRDAYRGSPAAPPPRRRSTGAPYPASRGEGDFGAWKRPRDDEATEYLDELADGVGSPFDGSLQGVARRAAKRRRSLGGAGVDSSYGEPFGGRTNGGGALVVAPQLEPPARRSLAPEALAAARSMGRSPRRESSAVARKILEALAQISAPLDEAREKLAPPLELVDLAPPAPAAPRAAAPPPPTKPASPVKKPLTAAPPPPIASPVLSPPAPAPRPATTPHPKTGLATFPPEPAFAAPAAPPAAAPAPTGDDEFTFTEADGEPAPPATSIFGRADAKASAVPDFIFSPPARRSKKKRDGDAAPKDDAAKKIKTFDFMGSADKAASAAFAMPAATPAPKKAAAPSTTTAAPSTALPTSGWGDMFKRPPGQWKCDACYVWNDKDKTKCVSCETPRSDPLSDAAGELAAANGNGAATPAGGAPTSAVAAPFTFGTPVPPALSKGAAPTPVPISFGAPTPKSDASDKSKKSVSFAAPEPPAASKPAFSFGGPATPHPGAAPADDAPAAPPPTFGFAAAPAAKAADEPKPAVSFGSSAAPAVTFGAPPAKADAPKADEPKPAFTFGAPTPTPAAPVR